MITECPEPNLKRIGRKWVDGNGIEQHWTACSEIWHLAWFVGAERYARNFTRSK